MAILKTDRDKWVEVVTKKTLGAEVNTYITCRAESKTVL